MLTRMTVVVINNGFRDTPKPTDTLYQHQPPVSRITLRALKEEFKVLYPRIPLPPSAYKVARRSTRQQAFLCCRTRRRVNEIRPEPCTVVKPSLTGEYIAWLSEIRDVDK